MPIPSPKEPAIYFGQHPEIGTILSKIAERSKSSFQLIETLERYESIRKDRDRHFVIFLDSDYVGRYGRAVFADSDLSVRFLIFDFTMNGQVAPLPGNVEYYIGPFWEAALELLWYRLEQEVRREKTWIAQRKTIFELNNSITIGSLMSGLIHEINNPLCVILGDIPFLMTTAEQLRKLTELYDRRNKYQEIVDFKEQISYEFLQDDIDDACSNLDGARKRIQGLLDCLASFCAAKTTDNTFSISSLLGQIIEDLRIKLTFPVSFALTIEREAQITGNFDRLRQLLLYLFEAMIDEAGPNSLFAINLNDERIRATCREISSPCRPRQNGLSTLTGLQFPEQNDGVGRFNAVFFKTVLKEHRIESDLDRWQDDWTITFSFEKVMQ